MADNHICLKEDIIKDLKEQLEKLMDNDREDYGVQKELSATIKLLAESNTELKSAIVEISNTLVKVNSNMDLMASEIKETNTRIDKIEDKLQDENDKNKIDIRDIQKEEVEETLGQKAKAVALPIGALAGIITFIYEVISKIKLGQ